MMSGMTQTMLMVTASGKGELMMSCEASKASSTRTMKSGTTEILVKTASGKAQAGENLKRFLTKDDRKLQEQWVWELEARRRSRSTSE